MEVRITTLSENTAGMGDYLAEWGWSALIETDEANVLLDAGASISAGYNVDALGVDLSKIDRIVLSHSHFDHTGGLRRVLRKMRKEVEIIAHPAIWGRHYVRRKGQRDRYIGLPFHRDELENLGARFNLTAKPVKISDNIMTTGEIPLTTDFEEVGSIFFLKEAKGWQPDTIPDDQAVILNTELGLVVVLGCAHRGVINTLYHAQKLTGSKSIYAVLGGCHLIDSNEERVWRTIAALKELGVQKLGLSHCTGLPAACIIAHEFGESFFFNNTGTRFTVP